MPASVAPNRDRKGADTAALRPRPPPGGSMAYLELLLFGLSPADSLALEKEWKPNFNNCPGEITWLALPLSKSG